MNTENKTVREKAMEWFNSLQGWGFVRMEETYPTLGLISINATYPGEIEELEKIYLSEHPEKNEPKEQTKGVIERNDEALQVLIKELEKSDVRKYTCINQSGYSQLERDIVTALFAHYHDTHYIPLLELCGELHLLLFDLVLWSKQVQGRVSISTSEEKLQEIKSAIEKAKQLLKQ